MRLLLIDDDSAFVSMMADYLTSEGFICECIFDSIAGLERAISGDFDAVILDIMMPKLNGIELLRGIRHESSVPVLMLTAKGDNIDRVIGLELGADDYLVKPIYPRELVARIHAIFRRINSGQSSAFSTSSEISIGPLKIIPSRRECLLFDQFISLTAKEFDLLLQLSLHPDEVVSKDELSERVMNRSRQPYDRSIDVHISNLRRKICESEGLITIETVRSIGYRLKAEK